MINLGAGVKLTLDRNNRAYARNLYRELRLGTFQRSATYSRARIIGYLVDSYDLP